MILEGKTVVITGAGRGLGRAMALRLARSKCNLALVDLEEHALSDTEHDCRQEGAGKTETYLANVANENDVVALFNGIDSDFDGLHGLVNNAGVTRDALLVKFKDGELVSKMSLQQWQTVIDVNLTGVFLCTREATAKMIPREIPGCIVNISSISRHGNMGQTNYTAAKAGVQAMTVSWAKELSRYGIRVASIAPGFIATDMVMSMKPEALDKLASMIPAKRLGDPDEIAHTVQFILENDYISGRCFGIDGALRL